jgi:predicted ATPase
MIESIKFQNFRALRDTVLPLDAFTLLVGANGSGKSTAMHAFRFLIGRDVNDYEKYLSIELRNEVFGKLSVQASWTSSLGSLPAVRKIVKDGNVFRDTGLEASGPDYEGPLRSLLESFRNFSFDGSAISEPVDTSPSPELAENGSNLPAVLDALRDSHPENFEAMNEELRRWLPEFDRILFRTPTKGKKSFLVRTTLHGHAFRPDELSQGVLFAIAFLTIAYLPQPPQIICFEEPDRGIHPRLLRDIQDALYRLAFPSSFGVSRKPVQVIATTHSPYLVDLFKDHPEQIVIAHKNRTGGHFERLSDKPHIAEILEGAPLGEIWYSGVLGGVPSTS